MSVTWDPQYETGNVSIDLQHRQLLAIVDGLEAAEASSHGSRDAILDVLGRVMAFNLTHFTMEEDLMRSVGYPVAARDEMIHQHQEFTAVARAQVLRFRDGDLTSVLPLKSLLVEWLVDHEFGLDKQLADFIRAAAAAPASEA